MESLYILIPLSICLLALAAKIFLWAVDHNQFDQLDQHGLDILKDDTETKTGEL